MNKIKNFIKEYSRAIIVIVICLLALGIWYLNVITDVSEQIEENQEEPEQFLEVNGIKVEDNLVYTKSIASVTNENTIEVIALSTGIVDKISVEAGEEVSSKSRILILEDTYTGNDTSEIQIEIAEKQLEQAKENLKLLEDNEDPREDIADEQLDDFEQRQEFQKQQLEDINGQILDLQNTIERTEFIINDLIAFENDIKNNNNGFTEDQLILQNRSSILQQQQSLNQQKASLDNLIIQRDTIQYDIENNSPSEVIAESNQEIARNQIDSEIELAELNVDLSELNLDLLVVQEELKTVNSPIDGQIDTILVSKGEFVNQGMPVAIVSGEKKIELKSKVSSSLAARIDVDERARIVIDNEIFEIRIDGVSKSPVDDTFHEVVLNPSADLEEKLIVGTTIEVDLPVVGNESENRIFIPIDSVFKSSINEFVLVINGENIAEERQIETGVIVGDQIEVIAGLNSDDTIILDRSVIPGTKVQLADPDDSDAENDANSENSETSEPRVEGENTENQQENTNQEDQNNETAENENSADENSENTENTPVSDEVNSEIVGK